MLFHEIVSNNNISIKRIECLLWILGAKVENPESERKTSITNIEKDDNTRKQDDSNATSEKVINYFQPNMD